MAAIDHTWRHAPAPLQRDDPTTWDAPHIHWAGSQQPKYVKQPRFLSPEGPSYRLYEGNDSEVALAVLPRHPAVVAVATGLMGAAPRPPRKIRGFYSIFPSAASGATGGFAAQQDAAVLADKAQQVGSAMHVDGAASQLGACLYLSDVPAGGGGFTVLPRSHVPLAREFTSEYNYDPSPSFGACPRFVWHNTCISLLCLFKSLEGHIHKPRYGAHQYLNEVNGAENDCCCWSWQRPSSRS